MIKKNTFISNWRYVNSKNNPADIVSRGLSSKAFIKNKTWFKGPTFLSNRVVEFDTFPNQQLVNKNGYGIRENRISLLWWLNNL